MKEDKVTDIITTLGISALSIFFIGIFGIILRELYVIYLNQ